MNTLLTNTQSVQIQFCWEGSVQGSGLIFQSIFWWSFISFFYSPTTRMSVHPSPILFLYLRSTKFQWKILGLFAQRFHLDTFRLPVIVIFQIINDTPLAADSISKAELIGLPMPALTVSRSSTVLPLRKWKNFPTMRGFRVWFFCGGTKMFLHFSLACIRRCTVHTHTIRVSASRREFVQEKKNTPPSSDNTKGKKKNSIHSRSFSSIKLRSSTRMTFWWVAIHENLLGHPEYTFLILTKRRALIHELSRSLALYRGTRTVLGHCHENIQKVEVNASAVQPEGD